MPDFLLAQPHGSFTEVFPNVFLLVGSFKFAPGLSIPRNMTVVRQGDELTVINTVRLTEAGEAELAKLGKVTHVLRMGAFHGADDPYYVHRYSPTLWAPPGTKHEGGIHTTRDLLPGSSPVAGSTVFLFEKAKMPETALVLDHDGGVLVTVDSYQHWTSFDGCSLLAKPMMWAMGFGPTLIGGPWAKRMGPDVRADFDRLLDAPFRHLIPGHGTVLRDTAKDGLKRAIAHRFSS